MSILKNKIVWLSIFLLIFFLGIKSASSASSLSSRLQGYILLQVESVGEAWYVIPKDQERVYMPNGSSAYQIMRYLSLGITNADLSKIPVGIEPRFNDQDQDQDGLSDNLEKGLGTDPNKADTDNDSFSDGEELKNNFNPLGASKLTYNTILVNRLKGYILLQVEKQGQAWYVNPSDGKRYYMQDGDAAYQIMRFLSLGITNQNLNNISISKKTFTVDTTPPISTPNPTPTPTPTPNPTPTPPGGGGGSGGGNPPSTPTPDYDSDNDGYNAVANGGTDCNDNNANIRPNATEICDSIDNNCNGQTDEGNVCVTPPPDYDNDNDGYNATTNGGDDCNDSSASIHPGATEICGNNIDEDCSSADLICSTCSQGAISSRCLCASTLRTSGYCCSNTYQTNSCPVPTGSGPSINAVSSSSLVDGQTYTITGSGFGAKSQATPKLMDWGDSPGYAGLTDMSDTPSKTSVPACSTCPWREGSAYYRHRTPKFVTNISRTRVPGRPVFFVGDGYDGFFRSERPWTSGIGPNSKTYVSWWAKWSTPIGSDQAYFVKMIRFYNNYAWNLPVSSQSGGINAEPAGIYYYGGGSYGPVWTAPALNTWHHYEMMLIGSGDLTTAGTRVVYKIDGETKLDNSTNYRADYGMADVFAVWGYDATDPYDFNRFAAGYELLFGEFYADDTLARIEICDAQTESQAAHCEIQVPQNTWASGAVQFKANKGSFAIGQQLYLYVIDANGNVNSSGYQINFSGSTDTTPPSIPTNLSATVSGTQVSLSWTASTDNTAVTGYNILRSTTNGSGYQPLATSATNSYINTGLTAGTTYYYVVRAYDAGGYTSGNSNQATAAIAVVTDTTPPSIPTNLSATVSGTQVSLSWTASTDNTAVTGYNILRSTTNGTGYQPLATSNTNSYTNTGLTTGTTYYYVVRAYDAGGYTSGNSNQATAAIVSAPPTGSGPSIDSLSDNSLNNGQNITISGSGFGTKITATPMIWDNMESGGFNSAWGIRPANSYCPQYSGQVRRGDLAISGESRHAYSLYSGTNNFQGNLGIWPCSAAFGQGLTAGFADPNPATGTYFAQYWFKMDNNWNWGGANANQGDSNFSLSNVKMFRTTNDVSGGTEDLVISMASHLYTKSLRLTIEGFGLYPAVYNLPDIANMDNIGLGTWHLFQFEYKESTLHQYDGVIRMWIDGARVLNLNNIITRDDEAPMHKIALLGWWNTAGDSGTDRDDFYIDDAYIDNTWSRIEIGNAPTYNACTHREVQVPNSWSNSSVNITVNRGSFAGGSAYLYVVDADGNVNSSGYSLTFN